SALPNVLAGPRSSIGYRIADFVAGVLTMPEMAERIEAMVRAAASEPQAAELLRTLVSEHVVGPVSEFLGDEQARLRANLVGSTVAGLVMTRRVLMVEPLASA